MGGRYNGRTIARIRDYAAGLCAQDRPVINHVPVDAEFLWNVLVELEQRREAAGEPDGVKEESDGTRHGGG